MIDEDSVVRGVRGVEREVLVILREVPPARDSDQLLWVHFLVRRGYDVSVDPIRNELLMRFPLSEYLAGAFPNYETVRRSRAKIQNVRGLFLPSDPAVLRVRGFREDVLRDYYGGDRE